MRRAGLILLIFLFFNVAYAIESLERGNLKDIFDNFLKGSATAEELAIIKEIASNIDLEVPAYLKAYTRGLMLEKRGEREKALSSYLESIKLKSDYNPSYFRFNELIRSVNNPARYREEITSVIRKRFETPPPVILKNPDGKYIFLVEKMSQYMLVYRGKRLIALYPVTTGAGWGDKWVEGDKKTPEGLYYFTRFIPPEKLPAIYGGIAVVLNYPNPVDRLLGKGGSGIWLHGSNESDREKIPFSTRGCVVADNDSLKQALKFIRLDNTLIGIYKTLPAKLKTDNIERFLLEWKTSWEEKDVEKFLSFYSDRFRWKGGGKREWSRYKRRVILGKKYIRVKISDITVLAFSKGKEAEYYLVEFMQEYESDTYRDRGLKRLYILKEGANINKSNLKIIHEGFSHGGTKKSAGRSSYRLCELGFLLSHRGL